MGILEFYSYLKKTKHIENVPDTKDLIAVDSVLVDANAELHRVLRLALETYSFYGKKIEEVGKVDAVEILPGTFLYHFRSLLYKELSSIIALHQPAHFGIAIDGVAPAAKTVEQRRRRYKGEPVKGNKRDYSSLALTPGTEFMIQINNMIADYCETIHDHVSIANSMTIWYSDHLCPGEGEHKIMEHLRSRKPTGNIVVYGNDNDLILLLGLIETEENQKIYIRRDYNGLFTFLSVKAVKEVFEIPFLDVVFLSFILGNDFIPRSPSIENNSLQNLIDEYKVLQKQHGVLVNTEKGIDVNWEFFQLILLSYARVENEKLQNNVQRVMERGGIDRLYTASINANDDFDISIYKAIWYRRALGPRDWNLEYDAFYNRKRLEGMVQQYYGGIAWSLAYYCFGSESVSKEWYYPYDYAPLITELVEVGIDLPSDIFTPTSWVSVLENLMIVIPPKFAYLLPTVLQDVVGNLKPNRRRNATFGLLADSHPSKFNFDTDGFAPFPDGTPNGVVILPPVDYNKIHSVFLAVLYYYILAETRENKSKESILREARKLQKYQSQTRSGYFSVTVGKRGRVVTAVHGDEIQHRDVFFGPRRSKNLTRYLFSLPVHYEISAGRESIFIPFELSNEIGPGDYSSLKKPKVRRTARYVASVEIGESSLYYPSTTALPAYSSFLVKKLPERKKQWKRQPIERITLTPPPTTRRDWSLK